MKSEVKISVIVPCYNAENYVEQCMESIINQEVKEIEILVINDGSSDNTLEILQYYAQNDTSKADKSK